MIETAVRQLAKDRGFISEYDDDAQLPPGADVAESVAFLAELSDDPSEFESRFWKLAVEQARGSFESLTGLSAREMLTGNAMADFRLLRLRMVGRPMVSESTVRLGRLVAEHLPGEHDQAKHGKKGTAISPGEKRTLPGAKSLLSSIEKSGGFTYHPLTDTTPTTGLAVSPFQDAEQVFKFDNLTEDDIFEYLKKHRGRFSDQRVHVGGWHDTEAGKVYLDLSVIVDDPAEATAIARKHNQEAYYDLAAGETVIVKGESERRIGESYASFLQRRSQRSNRRSIAGVGEAGVSGDQAGGSAVVEHTPGGKSHDQSKHGSKGSGIASGTADQTRTPEFKKWFGDSVVRDEVAFSLDGEIVPQVVYHGSPKRFDKFKAGDGSRSQAESQIRGIYFASDKEAAEAWGENVYPVYLKIERPMFVYGRIDSTSEQEALAGGYDGIIQAGGDEYVVFDPAQIESASTFNPDSPNITEQEDRLLTRAHRSLMLLESRAPTQDFEDTGDYP